FSSALDYALSREIVTFSLTEALPIYGKGAGAAARRREGLTQAVDEGGTIGEPGERVAAGQVGDALFGELALGDVDENAFHLHEADRKSTRLNSSHVNISYAVFCLKKK